MKITKIKTAKNHKDLYQIFIDGKFLCSINSSDLLESSLATNDEILDEEIESLLYRSLKGKLRSGVLNYLGRRPYSETELYRYLKRKLFDFSKETEQYKNLNTETIIEEILESLKTQNYINDKEFAQWLIKQRTKSRKPKSQIAIRSELLEKGVSKEIIEESLSTLEVNETETDRAQLIAGKKLDQLRRKNLNEFELKNKLKTYLMSKGYTWETVQSVVDSLVPPT